MLHNNSLCYCLNVHNVIIRFVKSGLVVCFSKTVNSVYRAEAKIKAAEMSSQRKTGSDSFKHVAWTRLCLRFLLNQAVKW